MDAPIVNETEKTLLLSEVTPKLSRRENARKRRTEHEIARQSVQNPCKMFPESSIEISPVGSVAEHPLGKGKVSGSIPLPGTTNQRGDLAEIMVTAKLARLGASVWTPAFGHDHPFDLIAHFNGHLSRVQIKVARDLDGGSILINGARVVDRVGGKQYPAITKDDCDVIIGYHIESDIAYVMRPVGKQRYQLRRTPPKNNQIIGIMYERDFRLTGLEQLRP